MKRLLRWLMGVEPARNQAVTTPPRYVSPRELARAQGFPDTYVLTGTKSQQVARIGNSVCPPIAKAMVEANYCSIEASYVAHA